MRMRSRQRQSRSTQNEEKKEFSDNVLADLDLLSDPVMEAKLLAQKRASERKTKALMASVAELQAEVKALRAQGKEHRRSQLIQGLKNRAREQELVCDVLKKELATRGRMRPEEVDDLVIKKSTGGPKRFRPKLREELLRELEELRQKHLRAEEALRRARRGATEGGGERGGRGRALSSGPAAPPPPPPPRTPPSPDGGGGGGGGGGSRPGTADGTLVRQDPEGLRELGALLAELEEARVARASLEALAQMKQEENDALRERLLELGHVDEELRHTAHRHEELRAKHQALRAERDALVRENDRVRDDRTAWKARLEHLEGARRAEADALAGTARGLEREIEELLERERRAQAAHADLQRAAAAAAADRRQAVAALKKEVAALERGKAALEADAARRAKEWDALFRQNEELNQQVRALPGLRADLREANLARREGDRRLLDAKKRLEALQSEAAALEGERAAASGREAAALRAALKADGDLREARERARHLEGQAQALREDLARAGEAARRGEAAGADREARRAEALRRRQEAADRAEKELQEQITAEQQKTSDAFDIVRKKDEEISSHLATIDEKEDQIKILTSKISAARVVQRKWASSKDEEKRARDNWATEKKHLENKNLEQAETIRSLEEQVEALHQRIDQVRESVVQRLRGPGGGGDGGGGEELAAARAAAAAAREAADGREAAARSEGARERARLDEENRAYRNALTLLQERNKELDIQVQRLEKGLGEH